MADEAATLALGEQALALLSPENTAFRAILSSTKLAAYYSSSANDVVAAIESGYQAILFAQEARQPAVTLCMVAATLPCLIGAGRLHEAELLIQQALLLEMQSSGPRLPEVGWVTLWRAEILREWNELDEAYSLATEAFSLCEQAISLSSLLFVYWGYAVLVRVSLSCGDLDAACTFLQEAEQIGQSMSQQVYQYPHSSFTLVDQVENMSASCHRQSHSFHVSF